MDRGWGGGGMKGFRGWVWGGAMAPMGGGDGLAGAPSPRAA
jgi:hypothetical protein